MTETVSLRPAGDRHRGPIPSDDVCNHQPNASMQRSMSLRADATALPIKSGSVQCVVTSPPYFGLRAYGTDEREIGRGDLDTYIDEIRRIAGEVWRILDDRGLFWLNLGDTASGSGGAGGDYNDGGSKAGKPKYRQGTPNGIPSMSWCSVPHRVVHALQDGHYHGVIQSEEDRAWLAGLVDADGTISIRGQQAHDGGLNPSFAPFISVSMSDKHCLDHVAAICERGSVRLKQAAGSQDSRLIKSTRDFWTWRIDGQVAAAIIQDIFPYLIVKDRQAILAWSLAQRTKATKPYQGLDPQELALRSEMHSLVKQCNQRESPTLTHVPLSEPPALATDNPWLLRADICWDKGVVRAEDVRHVRRPRLEKEPIFMLAKNRNHRYYHENEVEPGNVWRFPPARGKGNGLAPFPEELPRRCVLVSTQPGDLVVDPFSGSGTTVRVAAELNRRALGIDLYQ